jgi:uncharacterized protein YdeI (YjbR/CyaY-like superfamily)
MDLTIPTDLATWLDPDSRERFERLPARRRRAYVAAIEQAQSREVREWRVARTVQNLSEGRERW